MSNNIRVGFNFNDKHSSEFDIRLTGVLTPPPEIKKITDGVPHMNGEYDFTFMYGPPKYNNRHIDVDCFILCDHNQNMAQTENEIINWLYGTPFIKLTFDHQENREYTAKLESISFDEPDYNMRKLSFKLQFEAKPFAWDVVLEKEVL